jgi:hypothetical protein
VFDLPPLPPSAKQKPAAAAPTPATKPAATPTAAKAAPTTKTPVSTSTKKKKCSTFLGCK